MKEVYLPDLQVAIVKTELQQQLLGVQYRLMRSSLAVLSMPRCLDAARNATLNVVESLLDLEGALGYNTIMSHVDQLLESLRLIVVTAWTVPVSVSFHGFCFCSALLSLSVLAVMVCAWMRQVTSANQTTRIVVFTFCWGQWTQGAIRFTKCNVTENS